MSHEVSPEAIAPGVHRFERIARSGWCWNMFAVRLESGDLFLHNPTWVGEGTFERIDRLGRVRYLFTPNHFHNVHLRRFSERYPDAVVLAGARAIPRLARLGIRGVRAVEAEDGLAPLRVLSCAGTRNGETWLSLPREAAPALFVGDAFFNVTRRVSGLMGFLLRLLRVAPGLRASLTFRWLVRKKTYREWALATLSAEKPALLLPAHGEPAAGADLPARLAAIVDANFR
jgi:hypothetical protein